MWLDGYKGKNQLYIAYERLISALKTHVSSNGRNGEIYSMQLKPQESRSRYTYIKQNLHLSQKWY